MQDTKEVENARIPRAKLIETDHYLDAKETQGFLNFYTYFLPVSVSICLYIHTIIHTYQIVRNM